MDGRSVLLLVHFLTFLALISEFFRPVLGGVPGIVAAGILLVALGRLPLGLVACFCWPAANFFVVKLFGIDQALPQLLRVTLSSALFYGAAFSLQFANIASARTKGALRECLVPTLAMTVWVLLYRYVGRADPTSFLRFFGSFPMFMAGTFIILPVAAAVSYSRLTSPKWRKVKAGIAGAKHLASQEGS